MKYTFKTIVAPEHVRQSFTVLRDELASTDKQLMQAFWNLCTANRDAIEAEVTRLKELEAVARLEKKEQKIAAKLKEKEAKVPQKRGRKPKAEKTVETKTQEKAPKKQARKSKKNTKSVKTAKVVKFEEDADDVPCLVVDETN